MENNYSSEDYSDILLFMLLMIVICTSMTIPPGWEIQFTQKLSTFVGILRWICCQTLHLYWQSSPGIQMMTHYGHLNVWYHNSKWQKLKLTFHKINDELNVIWQNIKVFSMRSLMKILNNFLLHFYAKLYQILNQTWLLGPDDWASKTMLRCDHKILPFLAKP